MSLRFLKQGARKAVRVLFTRRPVYEPLPFPWVEGQIVIDGIPVVILNNPVVL